MSRRYGNDYLLALAKESTYGTKSADYSSTTLDAVLPCKVTVSEDTNPIQVTRKTGTLQEISNDYLAGYKSATVTIEDGLGVGASLATNPYKILFQGFFSDTATPYSTPDVGTTPFSYTGYQIAGTDNNHDDMTSCVFESLSISGSSGEKIAFSATLRSKMIEREESGALTPESPTQPDITPLTFCNASMSTWLGTVADKPFNSFNLQLSNTFADDKVTYQNNCTKQLEVLTKQTGTLDIEWNYDSSTDSTAYDNVVGTTVATVIKLEDSAGTSYYTITVYGMVMKYDRPDPDNGIFTGTANIKLLDSGSNMVTIATTYAS
jgi:hypothetical protein